MTSPLILLVASAVIVGGVATLVVIVAISVDSWQSIRFDNSIISRINNSDNGVTILSVSSATQLYRVTVTGPPDSTTGNSSVARYIVHSSKNGLWRTCDDLSDEDRVRNDDLLHLSVTTSQCFIFVTDYDEDSTLLTTSAKQIARLHNSAASCYIVVLIDLTSAIIVGVVGLAHKQVASCMVTGVLYFMAALFGVFGLAMFHTKHYYQTYECKSFDVLPEKMCEARVVEILYAVPLAWMGVMFCLLSCALWLIFARALRVIMAKTML